MRGGDVSKKDFEIIHDRYRKDLIYRDSKLWIGWSQEKCIVVAQKDFTYRMSSDE